MNRAPELNLSLLPLVALLGCGREGPEKVRAPGFPFVQAAFILATLYAVGFMILRQPTQAGLGLVTALLGVPMYWVFQRGQKRLPTARNDG